MKCPDCKVRIKVLVEGTTAYFTCPECKLRYSTWTVEEEDDYDYYEADRREIDSLRFQ
jgi:tRNA(Ile2) C34 agmatinyltransferase TiaS